MDKHVPAVEEAKACESDLTNDVIGLQEAIQEQQASLKGVPEGLRKEASELRAQLSCMGLLDRLEGLKGSLASASEADSTVPGEAADASMGGTPSAMDALYTSEQKEMDTDLQELITALNDAKETAAKLETDKMRLQKELLELQFLMNSGCDAAEPEIRKLPCIPETCTESGSGSPRISAIAEDDKHKPEIREAVP